MRIYPEAPQVFWNLSSVDFVSDSIIGIIRDSLAWEPNVIKAFNINYPHDTIPMDRIISWLKDNGKNVFSTSYKDWCSRLNVIDTSNTLFPLREYFQNLPQFPSSSSPSCKNLYELTKRLGIEPRGLNEQLFSKLVEKMYTK